MGKWNEVWDDKKEMKLEKGGWDECEWKMEGNDCARDEKMWRSGTQPLRLKSHK